MLSFLLQIYSEDDWLGDTVSVCHSYAIHCWSRHQFWFQFVLYFYVCLSCSFYCYAFEWTHLYYETLHGFVSPQTGLTPISILLQFQKMFDQAGMDWLSIWSAMWLLRSQAVFISRFFHLYLSNLISFYFSGFLGHAWQSSGFILWWEYIPGVLAWPNRMLGGWNCQLCARHVPAVLFHWILFCIYLCISEFCWSLSILNIHFYTSSLIYHMVGYFNDRFSLDSDVFSFIFVFLVIIEMMSDIVH